MGLKMGSQTESNLALAVQSYIMAARGNANKRKPQAEEQSLEEMVAWHASTQPADTRDNR